MCRNKNASLTLTMPNPMFILCVMYIFYTAMPSYHRFCLNETSCVQEDLYPTRCKIVVNNKGIPLPGQPPPTAKNQEPRKPHRPINITSLCRLSPMQSNQIQLQWIPSDLGQRYVGSIFLLFNCCF